MIFPSKGQTLFSKLSDSRGFGTVGHAYQSKPKHFMLSYDRVEDSGGSEVILWNKGFNVYVEK